MIGGSGVVVLAMSTSGVSMRAQLQLDEWSDPLRLRQSRRPLLYPL